MPQKASPSCTSNRAPSRWNAPTLLNKMKKRPKSKGRVIAQKKIFGTDGVRGTANIEPVTAETALKLGRAAGHVFKNLQSEARSRGHPQIVLGEDTRLSGYMLENAISSGILS